MRIDSGLQTRPASIFAAFVSELDEIAKYLSASGEGPSRERRGPRTRQGEILRALAASAPADQAGLRLKARGCLIPVSAEHAGAAQGMARSLAADVVRLVEPSDAPPAAQSVAPASGALVQLLDAKAVAAMLGVTRPTLYAWIRERGLPAPLAISEQCVRWRLDEMTAWINALPRTTLAESLP